MKQADDVAKLWGAALGKTITVQGSDAEGLDSVEKHFAAGIGPAGGRDLRLVSFGKLPKKSRLLQKSVFPCC